MAIKVTPEELEAMAGKLSTLATEASALASKVEQAIAAGVANWEGNSATKYQEEYAKIKPVLATNLPQMLNDFANEAKTRATNFINSDK